MILLNPTIATTQSFYHPMEERPPPPKDNPPFPIGPPPYESGTYIVQVPKGQIHYIPPPENVKIAESFRNAASQKRSCCPGLFRVFLTFFILSLAMDVFVSLFYLLFCPESPKFSIVHLTLEKPKALEGHVYEILLKAKNPNEITGICYDVGAPSMLSFKGKTLAVGQVKTFYQSYMNSNLHRLVLVGLKKTLPHEIERSVDDTKLKAHISLLLRMTIPVRMKTGLLNTWITYGCQVQL